LQRLALIVGAVGVIGLVIGFVLDPGGLRRAFLPGWSYWTGIAVGSLAITMIQHLTGGVWGMTLRRFTEAGAFTIPLMGVLYFLVVGSDVAAVYPWARPGVIESSPALELKAGYLDPTFFLIRVFVYFLVWTVFALILNAWSTRMDATGDLEYRQRLTRVSAPGIVLFAVTITLAAVDLIMSLEPEWFSTMFGVLIGMSMVLSAFSFMLVTLSLLTIRGPLRDVMSPEHFHDVGKLLHAFIILWTYFGFSQFVIIWVGNLPFEAVYYVNRLNGGWQWVALTLLVLQFIVPFVLLLSRGLKRNPRKLIFVAGLVMCMQVVNMFWYIQPAFSPREFRLDVMNVVALAAVGGIWLAAFLWRLGSRPLLPLHVLPSRHPRMRRGLENVGH